MNSKLQDEWPDLSGRLKGTNHVLPIRVYYEDTDFSGLVYHAAYLKWCERARSEFVRLTGLSQRELYEGGEGAAFFVVRHMELDYLKPAVMDDVVEVETRCQTMGSASVTLLQTVKRFEVNLFKAVVKIVLINQAGRPMRLSKAVRGAFGGSDLT